ncbi:MAG: DEAD/DEAH box helicase family protein [Peptococcaceae bacterium]|nr:DEAD/DEAH box helicase family protein [Peptococcaceae bacterium]NLP45396.1 DEAD/DEAH box helicase family protein [Peptococcaceae bacterium]
MNHDAIKEIEKSTMRVLKDFQRETVNRIEYLFRNGQNRVLVADEVGLGKTLIARGVVVKTARMRFEEGDDLFKVIYICANQNIANQNIRKLKVYSKASIGDIAETRLSMQHLCITEQERDENVRKGYIQLIPLTPDTSFRMTKGGGSVNERALMYALLVRIDFLEEYKKELETLLIHEAKKEWPLKCKYYRDKVNECEVKTKGIYPANILAKILDYFSQDNDLKDMLISHLRSIRNNTAKKQSDRFVINKLRIMFAKISVSMLQPDLVIMDEFQRFKYLIASDENSEIGILARKFLNNKDTRILLLSATPYKLYSTLDEINEYHLDEHYCEFFDVMKFLFNSDKKFAEFKRIWSNYSVMLNELKEGDTAILQLKKQAEDAMYRGVCRTERIGAVDIGDYIDDSAVKEHLAIQEYDIKSYLDAGKLLKDIGADFTLPVDYVKSSPYLLSFMRNYKLKEKIEKYFKNNPDRVNMAKSKLLWLDTSRIDRYEELPKVNARLECLMKNSFSNESELYLWVPPSKPYYEFKGVYKNSKGFSKILVFSAWEMVPRMIATLVSYEAERRTVGRLYRQIKNEDRKNTRYFADASKRFPTPRMRFNVQNGEPRGMNMFNLLYPSKYLADLYKPIACMNEGLRLSEIEKKLKKEIEAALVTLKKYRGITNRQDDRWYYLAPMLLDGPEYVEEWLGALRNEIAQNTDNVEGGDDRGNIGLKLHLDRLEEMYFNRENLGLGKEPKDLVPTLVNMAIASPAVCLYRTNGGNLSKATALARVFINRFNTTEATAIVALAYRRYKDDMSHWKNVLRYCKDGNFQAMIDEYHHLLSEAIGFVDEKDKQEVIFRTMMDALQIHSASYDIDTFSNFKARIEGRKNKHVKLRSHFAVGFTKGEGDSTKSINRKENVRNAFNSPLRPFVLATTSIGQEGLDFHNYCRKIMHWNLPANPVDLEQREGRINRFKCLAIRQSVAEKYGTIKIKKDVWKEIFEEAVKQEKKEGKPDLVPFWCLGNGYKYKIERIVPMYPLSKDVAKYEKLIKILSLYRLTLGQARQEELLEYIFNTIEDWEKLKGLFINLSPYSKGKRASI